MTTWWALKYGCSFSLILLFGNMIWTHSLKIARISTCHSFTYFFKMWDCWKWTIPITTDLLATAISFSFAFICCRGDAFWRIWIFRRDMPVTAVRAVGDGCCGWRCEPTDVQEKEWQQQHWAPFRWWTWLKWEAHAEASLVSMSRSDVLKVDDLWLLGRVNFSVSLKWFWCCNCKCKHR